MKQFSLFFLFFLCFTSSKAQVPFYYVNATIYDEKEGYVIFNRVNDITEDNNGLIWIGSENGLQSFNGTYFKSYRHSTKDSNSLPGSYVQFMYQDKEDIYWTYIRGKGLYIYDPQKESFSKFQYLNEKDFNLHPFHQFQVGCPFEDSKGRLWFPLLGYGLAELDKKRKIVIPYKICIPGNCGSFYNASWVTKIFEDNKGEFWLATNSGLVHFNPQTGKYEEVIEQELQTRRVGYERHSIFNFFGEQIGNHIWIGTWGSGIKRLNTITKKFETFLWKPKTWDGTKNICTGIWKKDSAHLWVSSLDNELFIFDLQTLKFQPVRQIDDPEFGFRAHEMIKAKDGSLWMTHDERKLIKISNSHLFSSYIFENKKAFNPELLGPNCFLKMNNKLYIGAGFDMHIYNYDLLTQTYASYQIQEKNGGETNFLLPSQDQNGFYVGGYRGLFFFNTQKQKFEKLKANDSATKLLNQELIYGETGKDNSIWLSCRNTNALLQYDSKTGTIKQYPIPIPNPEEQGIYTDYWVNSIVAGNDNTIWFSHSHYGLGSLHIPDGKIVFFNSYRRKGFPTGFSTDVTIANDSSIYFTIQGEGVWRLKNPFTIKEEMINYDHANGLPSDMIRYIHQDEQKRLWFFSSNGLSLFDPLTATAKNFSEEDGLKDKTLVKHPYEDANGVIYVGFNHAFQTFHPDSLARKEIHSYKLIINDFKVNNSSIPINVNYVKKLILKPKENYLQFQYAAITHDNPQQLNYSYMLEGFDEDWINAGTTTSGNYNNLPAGDYTLKIKIHDNKEPNDTNYFQLPIVISGYWFKATWFKLLLGGIFLILVYLAMRYRIGMLHKEARLKTEFAQKMAEVEMRALRSQMNPHFIFNCLSSINRYIVKSDHKTASNYLTKFSKLIRLILDNSAADVISIERELQSLQLYIDMEALRFDHAFTYSIQVDEKIDKEESFMPSMLLQPYVENAIWHGLLHKENGDGKLTITVSGISDKMLLTCIEDNGVGRQKAKEMKSKEIGNKKSYGMQISHDRLALLNHTNEQSATVLIEDLVNENGIGVGTRVTLHVPMLKTNQMKDN